MKGRAGDKSRPMRKKSLKKEGVDWKAKGAIEKGE
jgi:hypothetical protein